MKNLLKITFTILSLVAFVNASNAQVIWGNYTVSPTYSTSTNLSADIFRNGAIGIGWNSPYPSTTAKLMVNGDVDIRAGLNNTGNIKLTGNIIAQSSTQSPLGFSLIMNSTTGDGAVIGSDNTGNSINFNAFSSGSVTTTVPGTGSIAFNGATTEWMRLRNSGKVTIGGTGVADAPAGYRLSVGEGIITQKLRVCPSASAWCDYVFEKDYNRNPLDYVAKYVAENKHLPNVPSAQEVGENGINVAEMDAVLLRQIEEIWLHLIDLKQENEQLKASIDQLSKGSKPSDKK
jgi:trimeric autotransporter adhesin